MSVARKEVWIIGNKFLEKGEPYLGGIRAEADQKHEPLYIFNNYDVKIATGDPRDNNPLSRIINSLIELLKNNLTIPHTLVIVTDESLAQDADVIQSGEIVDYFFYLFKEFKRIIFSRRHQLPVKTVPDFKTRYMITRLTPKAKPFSLENRFKT